MNKQIEELGKEIHLNCHCCLFEDEAESIAKFVIEEQGYRKQEDVAREIFSEIDDARDDCTFVDELNISHFKTSKFLLCLDCIKKKHGVMKDC